MVIETSKGPVDEKFLTKKEYPGVVEYYLHEELVHRSATVQLTGVQATGTAQL